MSKLTSEEIYQILLRKERWIALSTIGKDGFPHTVPTGYFPFGDRVVVGCRDHTQKVKNIERNPQVSVLWENGRGENELIGILLQGTARIVRDDAERLELKAEACRQRNETAPESVAPGAVYIEVIVEKTISWRRPTRQRR